MADWRTMYDYAWVRAWDLQGQDVTVEIIKVEQGMVEDKSKGKKDRVAVIWLKGKQKPLGLNKTNGKTIAGMYGNETKNWIGKLITLFPTTTQMMGETKDCIRVRPNVPKNAKADVTPLPEPPKEEEQQRG